MLELIDNPLNVKCVSDEEKSGIVSDNKNLHNSIKSHDLAKQLLQLENLPIVMQSSKVASNNARIIEGPHIYTDCTDSVIVLIERTV